MSLDSCKVNAALRAVDMCLDADVVGVGTGSTVEKFIEAIARDERFRRKLFVASSIDTASKLASRNLIVLDPSTVGEVDVYVDGADEVDGRLRMIKGGGAALTMEKVLCSISRRRIIVVDYTKRVDRLGERHPVPVEVLPWALRAVTRRLGELGFKAEPRATPRKAGPLVSDLGGVIVDVYTGPMDNPEEVHALIKMVPGVVETGIFVGMADVLIIGFPSSCTIVEGA